MPDFLNPNQIQEFIHTGFLRLDHAFSRETAAAAVDILWKDLPVDRADPSTWSEPVVWLGMYTQPPFVESVNTPKLHHAFNQLVGEGRWLPCRSVGAFPVRFPAEKLPIDTGKHVDASFPGEDPANYIEWRVNLASKGRALLLLVLYSDVTEADAPTVLYKGSHLDVANLLSTEGEQGLSFMELAKQVDSLPEREQAFAVGQAGTVYLCHPFLVHAAQAHRGKNPKFMAQPPLFLQKAFTLDDSVEGHAPVETAIRLALGK
ncbi:phytanoyl-CoA dioxygenase family protein [Rufibacter quisquiliarum]|uniref:Phytanoyl-CoA dioxygenase n=1 Tax=Rufibacter quisquiliarum TaxID=1549639 RepID=A0A839GIN6_9BACT|nr:phytanoyl-CoA dioxygenase family protein [Rufibacter quisquiliarum]MBA9078490.1 hypothetical protein [Rufibacter quisquiliarum]